MSLLIGPNHRKFGGECDRSWKLPFDYSVVSSARGESLGGHGGVHGGTRIDELASLRCLLDNEELYTPSRDRPVFLDLGSGVGIPVIYGAKHNWHSFGIDLSPECCHAALENIAKSEAADYIPTGMAKVALGTFLPKDFALARRLFDHFKAEVGRPTNHNTGFASEFKKRMFAYENDNYYINPYRELGVKLNEVDLFYHYQVEHIDWIVEMLSKYAKPGALLLFNRSMNDLPKKRKNIKLVDSAFRDLGDGEILHLYQRVA